MAPGLRFHQMIKRKGQVYYEGIRERMIQVIKFEVRAKWMEALEKLILGAGGALRELEAYWMLVSGRRLHPCG